ncbi:HD-GYP domain-containing protein [Paenibacillus eucommiae]|uniref:HD-GYP domain-containing protein (C-di-GMP phosphodiesterase class II) n=1 Tax=Paenibacillus eucommiae TaxID=1355755 RepID=A0ABS4IXR1_9BACL|nr:HD domain-containing phosphohydrolase [Paenibacillus eucommiae]MBP1992357.1 HD-GYP domain-containing protein (c-di-GMP phosphodiesterase class II) [Paenibacillus eucommiae]
MRILPTLLCQSGMRLGKTIFTDKGQVLVGVHVSLTDNMIRKLSQMGIQHLYIDDPRTDDIHIVDPIQEETRLLLSSSLSKVFEKFGATAGISSAAPDSFSTMSKFFVEGMSRVIDDLQTLNNDHVMVSTLNQVLPSSMEQHFTQKALNMCIHATKLAMAEGSFNREELMNIGLSALLYDVGSVHLPLQLLQKADHLTQNEYLEIKKHPEYGFQLLKNEAGIPEVAALCALQHHERINGSGYPYGLTKDEIHPYARWIGMLDSYDALIHPRSYRQALPPNLALEALYAGAGTLYDIDMVRLFRNHVAIFPIGLSVSLSSGDKGVVSQLNFKSMQRPVIRVLKNASGEDLKEPYEIDLSRKLNIVITKIGEQTMV